MKKIIGIILIGLFLVGVGFAIAKIIGGVGGQIEKELTFSVIVTAIGDYTLAMTPVNGVGEPELTIPKGQTGTFTITLVPSGGFDADVQLTIAGLPDGSYSFAVNPIPFNAAGMTTTLTINSAPLESNRVYVCNLTASDI
jgi:hypothetical protein